MLIDLSHAVADGTVTYPGLPAPKITEHPMPKYAPGTTFHIARIERPPFSRRFRHRQDEILKRSGAHDDRCILWELTGWVVALGIVERVIL